MTPSYTRTHESGCGCGCHHSGPPLRVCCREPKEVLVEPSNTKDQTGTTPGAAAGTPSEPSQTVAGFPTAIAYQEGAVGFKRAIIGGGCCVSLSIEYMPSSPSLASTVVAKAAVAVLDSAGASMLWERQFTEGYHVQECIITTNPGAQMLVAVSNAIARVRWCEVFSC